MLNLRDPALALPGPSTFNTGPGPGARAGRVSTLVHVSADRALWTGVAPDDPDCGYGAVSPRDLPACLHVADAADDPQTATARSSSSRGRADCLVASNESCI